MNESKTCYNCIFGVFSPFNDEPVECELLEKAYNIPQVKTDRINCPLFCSRENTINLFIKVHKRDIQKNKYKYLLDGESNYDRK